MGWLGDVSSRWGREDAGFPRRRTSVQWVVEFTYVPTWVGFTDVATPSRLVDHLADKFCAVVTRHSQAGAINSSGRVKDLVDIALIAGTQLVSAHALRAAVVARVLQASVSV